MCHTTWRCQVVWASSCCTRTSTKLRKIPTHSPILLKKNLHFRKKILLRKVPWTHRTHIWLLYPKIFSESRGQFCSNFLIGGKILVLHTDFFLNCSSGHVNCSLDWPVKKIDKWTLHKPAEKLRQTSQDLLLTVRYWWGNVCFRKKISLKNSPGHIENQFDYSFKQTSLQKLWRVLV